MELKIRAYADQIDALAAHLTKIPNGVNPAPIFAQKQKMEVFPDRVKLHYLVGKTRVVGEGLYETCAIQGTQIGPLKIHFSDALTPRTLGFRRRHSE